MPKMLELAPAEFHDREYLKPILALEQGPEAYKELFKKLDGAESLLGKRPVIPGKDAKPEELDKFFEQFRPEKPEDYEIPVAKDGAPVNDAFLKAVRSAFHAGKISKVQAQNFLKTMTEFGTEQAKVQAQARAKTDAEFDTLAKAALGEQNKLVMERTKKLIAEHAPQAFKGQVEKLDDKSLLIMTGVIDAVLKQYVSEDKLNGKAPAGGTGAGGAGDAKSKREEMRKLIGSKAFSDWQNPEHESTNAKVQELAKELAAAGA